MRHDRRGCPPRGAGIAAWTPWTSRLARTALALLAALAPIAPAGATHAPDHRFLVIGRLTDTDGQPLPDRPVLVTRLRTGLEYRARTEPDGFYLVVLHLHDEDEGERLSVAAGGIILEVRARFDVADKRVERGTRVDIRGGEAVEDRTAFARTLRQYLAR